MIDPRFLEDDNMNDTVAKLKSKGCSEDVIHTASKLFHTNKTLTTLIQELAADRNAISNEIGERFKNGDGTELIEPLTKRSKEISKEINELLTDCEEIKLPLRDATLCLPNLPADDVPEGLDESSNVVQDVWVPDRGFSLLEEAHDVLGENLGLMSKELGANIAGSRFTVMRGALARLERVLGFWMLERNTSAGWEEASVPLLVNNDAMTGTGQFPKFTQDCYSTSDGLNLLPTGEVPLTNMVAGQLIDMDALPIRLTAETPCFRREAGSAGRDTRGLIRQHQFNKVELVTITTPEMAEQNFEEMVGQVHVMLKELGLPHRQVLLCRGDLGFSAAKTIDFEVWMPSQHTYREISSVSWCSDFQARRMKARFKDADGSNRLVHTLNGSGLAVGRTLAAIIENYQREDGGIDIPEPLQDLMGARAISKSGDLI